MLKSNISKESSQRMRRVSCNEQLYLDLQKYTNSYAIQFVLEVQGQIDLDKINMAAQSIVRERNGVNVIYKNGEWHAGKSINVKTYFMNSDDFLSIPMLKEPINHYEETIIIHVVNGLSKDYLIFQFSHAAYDGKGALTLIHAFFDELKGQKMRHFENSITDIAFIKALDCKKERPQLSKSYSMLGSCPSSNYDVSWRIISAEGYQNGIMGKLAKVIAKHFEADFVPLMIPTDIRRHNKQNEFIGNLTLPIFLNVGKDDTWEKINGNLLFDLKNKKELNRRHASYFNYNKLPQGIRNLAVDLTLKIYSRFRSQYLAGAILSHLGRVNLSDFNNSDFKVINFVSIPIQQPFAPFSMVLLELDGITNVALSYYTYQTDQSVVDSMVLEINKLFEKPNVYKFNQTSMAHDSQFINLLIENIEHNGELIAVADDNQTYSYNELKRNIFKYRRVFVNRGLVKGDRVALHMARSFEYLSALIACIFSGIVFIPIDIATAQVRVEQILDSKQIKIVITDSQMTYENKQTPVERINDISNTYVESNIDVFRVNKFDTMYEIFTSGTTGALKCVPINYGNFNNYISWAKREYATSKKMVMPLFTSISVDLTLTATLLPLLCGGTVKASPNQFDNMTLSNIFSDKSVNLVKLTPTHLTFLSEGKHNLNHLEALIVGGENFTKKSAERAQEIVGSQCRIYNEYGPTETTVGSSYHKYDGKDDSEIVSIGVPIDNTEIVLWDDLAGVVQGEKVVGEIMIAGKSVFSGYSNQVLNSLREINGQIFYGTGDLGYVYNQQLYCLGRKDNQVKIHGHRIELEEIQNNLESLKDIKNAIVIEEKGTLHAFIKSNEPIDTQEVLKQLRKKLPDYMIPKSIVEVTSFPLSGSGKIHTAGLTQLLSSPTTQEGPLSKYLPEGTPYLEDKLLFELGLDSFEILKFLQSVVEDQVDSVDEDIFFEKIYSELSSLTLKTLNLRLQNSGEWVNG